MKNKTECRICDNNKSTRQLCDKHYDEFIAFSEGKNQPPHPSPKLEEMLDKKYPLTILDEDKLHDAAYCATIESLNRTAKRIRANLTEFYLAGQQSIPSHKISDREIEIASAKYAGTDGTKQELSKLMHDFQNGAKWYRDNYTPPQQQEIDWSVIESEFNRWAYTEFTNEEHIAASDTLKWLKKRPEFSQPTGEQDKELPTKDEIKKLLYSVCKKSESGEGINLHCDFELQAIEVLKLFTQKQK